MSTLTISAVSKRQNFLIDVYQSDRKNKKRANQLIDELRARYNFKNETKPHFIGNVTPDQVSGNGKYSFD